MTKEERSNNLKSYGIMGTLESGEQFASVAIQYLTVIMHQKENEIDETNPWQFAWRKDGHACTITATPDRITLDIVASK